MIHDATPAIEVKGLECHFDDRAVLEDVSFRVSPGEIFFIIGGSGCGKTTLLRNMVGLIRPGKGEVRFNGRPFTDADTANRRSMLKTFGMLFQSGALWTSLTLSQNVALPLEEYTKLPADEIRNIATFKLAQVGLTGFEEHYPCASGPASPAPWRWTPRLSSSTSRPRASTRSRLGRWTTSSSRSGTPSGRRSSSSPTTWSRSSGSRTA